MQAEINTFDAKTVNWFTFKGLYGRSSIDITRRPRKPLWIIISSCHTQSMMEIFIFFFQV